MFFCFCFSLLNKNTGANNEAREADSLSQMPGKVQEPGVWREMGGRGEEEAVSLLSQWGPPTLKSPHITPSVPL